jgi:peroxiredoxin
MRLQATWLLMIGLVMLGATARADEPAPSKAKLGKQIPNLTFVDDKGKSWALHDLKDQKAVVIVFMSFECPVSNGYCPTLIDMVKEFGAHGVTFVGLTVNEDDSREHVAKQAKEFDANFPVFKDEKLRAAQALEADFTPECFVLDGDFTLRYRGRIDDRYAERLQHQPITRHDLSQALGELLSGRPVATPATRAMGCMIPRIEQPLAKTGPVTYHRDVLPILQNHCQTCHRPGEVGPFSLMTYKQAVNWAADIKTYTHKRIMPPWKPAGGVEFLDERKLSDRELKTLAAWADNGTPEGDPKDAPPPKQFPAGWQLGTPDLILTPESEFTLGPDGGDVFRCFALPTKTLEDHYVTAVEIRPSNNRVVHHVLLFTDTKGRGRDLEARTLKNLAAAAPEEESHPRRSSLDKGPGYSVTMGVGFQPDSGLRGWAPGSVPKYLPEGSGMFLPKGADVIMQVHYHRNGRLERDRTQVGLYFAKKPVERPFAAAVVAGGSGSGLFRLFFSIPAGDPRFSLKGQAHATKDFVLYAVTPHMHMLGKEIALTMIPPDGEPKTIIDVKDWDYNWQETYMLKEPIAVKAGTRFEVSAVYDNSAANPRNPFNPPRRITFGEQTTNEMCFVFLGGTTDNPTARRNLPVSGQPPKKAP